MRNTSNIASTNNASNTTEGVATKETTVAAETRAPLILQPITASDEKTDATTMTETKFGSRAIGSLVTSGQDGFLNLTYFS